MRRIALIPLFGVLILIGLSASRYLRSPTFRSPEDSQWLRGDVSRNLALMAASAASADLTSNLPRIVYPYSVVAGGVRTPEELRDASERDPLIASHYAGFDFRNARVITLEHPKLVYLSYRQRDKIFWTKRQVTLSQGERLLTDGKIFARTRCANRVSVAPHRAASSEEPSVEQLDRPVGSGTAMRTPFPVAFESNLLRHPTSDWSDPAAPPNSQWGYGQYAGNGFPLTFPPPIPDGGGTCLPTKPKKKGELTPAIELEGKKKPRKNPCAPGPSGPPATVPEPGTFILFAFGLAATWLSHRKSRLQLS